MLLIICNTFNFNYFNYFLIMGVELGYDQLDKGNVVYLKYPFSPYFLCSKDTKHRQKYDSNVKFNKYFSTYENKYSLKINNFLVLPNFNKIFDYYFNYHKNNNNNNNNDSNKNSENLHITNDTLSLSFESTKRSIKNIIFSINPCIKLHINSMFSLYYQKFYADKNQNFLFFNKLNSQNTKNIYDFFPSLVPVKLIGVKFDKNFSSKNFDYNVKFSLNDLKDYESNLKLRQSLNFFIEKSMDFGKVCVNNSFTLKNSYIFHTNYPSFPHLLSSFSHINSKILSMDINKGTSPGKFYVQNLTTLRLNELKFLERFYILKYLNPFFSLETFYLDSKHEENWLRNRVKFIYSFGFSLMFQDKFYLDFSLFSGASKNIGIKKKFINSIRFKLNKS